MPEEYGLEYDSTFYFSITQFRIDSLDKASLPKFEFDGVFYSNNILFPLEAKLITMPDNSFGFVREIDNMGLPAYDNKITINNRIQMDSSGLYVKGNFMYQTTSVFSDKIRLFPDSIQGYLDKGFMSNGKMKKSNKKFPEMEFNNLDFASIVCTNIKKDGAMKGIDLNFILNNINIFKKPIIASGGVTSLKDLQTLKNNETKGIEGVICGRAIYEGKIDIMEANKIFEIN